MNIDIPVYKQGELGFACGLYCLQSVAEALGVKLPYSDAPLASFVGAKEERLKRTGAWKSRVMPLVWGIGVDAMEKMAKEAGMQPRRAAPAGDLRVFDDAYLSIALVFCHFDHPQGWWPSYGDAHYLVVRREEGTLWLADSHPWKPHVRPIADPLFHDLWTDERLEIPGWAICFDAPSS